jgi:hypothetical protein
MPPTHFLAFIMAIYAVGMLAPLPFRWKRPTDGEGRVGIGLALIPLAFAAILGIALLAGR